jgi:ketosteroid isomerase-like protein
MLQENVDLISQMYAAFHGGDPDRALSYFDEDVVVDATARVDGGMGRGREELGRIIGQWVAMFEDWHEEIEQVHELGDQVCVVARQGGRGRDSGIETETRYAVMYEVHGKAITRMTLYREPADALRAVGVEAS